MHGVKLVGLESLKKIYILYMKKGQAVSRISDEQEELLKKIGVDMSMCWQQQLLHKTASCIYESGSGSKMRENIKT